MSLVLMKAPSMAAPIRPTRPTGSSARVPSGIRTSDLRASVAWRSTPAWTTSAAPAYSGWCMSTRIAIGSTIVISIRTRKRQPLRMLAMRASCGDLAAAL